MREIPVRLRLSPSTRTVDDVTKVLREHRTLQDVFEWCQSQRPPRELAAVVVQDEFTHDLVLEVGGGLVAVYDTT